MTQLELPWVVSAKTFKYNMTKFNRLRSFSLEEGLKYLRNQSQRKIAGNWIEDVNKMSATRIKMFLTGRTTCIKCGIKGDHFHIERHKNDKVMPYSVNLYGWKGDREVLMTWDHILPRSLGGSNRLENAQCMCTECNGDKGSRLSIYEVIAIVTDHNAALMYRDEVVHPKSTIFITLAQVMAEWNKL